jgi:CRISPR-associated protein (TIGR03986 family)
VFFGDGILDGGYKELKEIFTILGGPKPTTYQHYLAQPNENIRHIRHYDSNGARLRGFKRYWHKQHSEAPRADEEQKNVATYFRPIKVEGHFNAEIRFENLSAAELGALIFVLNLPANLRHQLGMAKPYGFGRVKISAALELLDLEKRHSAFAAGLWEKDLNEEKSAVDFYEAFTETMLEHLRKKEPSFQGNNLWRHPRLQELAALMHLPKGDSWDDYRRYLVIKDSSSENEYKDRKVLPLASEVFLKGDAEHAG